MAGEKFHKLREEYKVFSYKDYQKEICDNKLKVSYFFEIEGLESFVSKWEFPLDLFENYSELNLKQDEANNKNKANEVTANILNNPILDKMIFSLGMVEAISYYKITCPKIVKIEKGTLTSWQKKWWKKLFRNGLGEFLYLNGIEYIEIDDLFDFECAEAEDEPLHDDRKYEGALVPVGGGKDSVVSLEVLKGEPIVTYTINGNETTRNVINCCDYKVGDYVAKRILDKKILEMNERGFLNGHIPFSAVVAFSTVISAFLSGKQNIALSNENSANESTVKDSFVNHQYSKSYEFEKDFMEYFISLTDSDIHYFSLLRPLTELQIAWLFADAKQYHTVFRSCNRGSKQGIWCCDCPKCLFVYIILSPFLSDEELLAIFGEKLFDKESLDKDFRELCGIEENKPFECVGTRREVLACLKRFKDNNRTGMLNDRYASQIDTVTYDIDEMLKEWNAENSVPEKYLALLNKAIARKQGNITINEYL